MTRLSDIARRVDELEVRVTALEQAQVELRPPEVTFGATTALEVELLADREVEAVVFVASARMEVWA